LQGESHSFDATNTSETPSVKQLQGSIQDVDNWLIHYAATLTQTSLDEMIHFTFTDGDAGSMSRNQILNHLIIHGAYHRDNIGMLLTECGINRPSDTFTKFLHQQKRG